MTIEVISTLITTLGLPIVLILVMGWFIFKLWKQSAEREQKLYDEIAKSREINEQAISTLTLYAERLTVIEEDIKEIKDIVK